VVATRWGLPAQVCGAILLHHASRERTLAEPAALLVERCNQFLHASERHGSEAAMEVFDREVLRALGLLVRDVEELSEFVESARGSVEI
jgi:HD-like signal output (HDOD) protein